MPRAKPLNAMLFGKSRLRADKRRDEHHRVYNDANLGVKRTGLWGYWGIHYCMRFAFFFSWLLSLHVLVCSTIARCGRMFACGHVHEHSTLRILQQPQRAGRVCARLPDCSWTTVRKAVCLAAALPTVSCHTMCSDCLFVNSEVPRKFRDDQGRPDAGPSSQRRASA